MFRCSTGAESVPLTTLAHIANQQGVYSDSDRFHAGLVQVPAHRPCGNTLKPQLKRLTGAEAGIAKLQLRNLEIGRRVFKV